VNRVATQVVFGGAQEFRKLSKRMEKAAGRRLTADIETGVTRALQPLRTSGLPASARATLPRRGGLAEAVAATPWQITRRRTRNTTRVRLEGTNRYRGLRQMDRGSVRHPVPGTGKWVTQQIRPGWITKPALSAAPRVRREVDAAVERFADELRQPL
jgi:hypothetical protein